MNNSTAIAVFSSQENFLAAHQMAEALAHSTLVPQEYRGQAGLPNCLIALELAARMEASPLMVMQNLHIIHGRPSFGASFVVAAANACGRFSPIRYETRGTLGKPDYACRAVATDVASQHVLDGAWIDAHMVKAEGWSSKSGSKWLSMPEQMYRYRAASFWVRTYAPELLMGMHTSDEVEDAAEAPAPPAVKQAPTLTNTRIKTAKPAEIAVELPAPPQDAIDAFAEASGWSMSMTSTVRGRVAHLIERGIAPDEAVALDMVVSDMPQ